TCALPIFGPAILASTLTTLVIFLPLVFVRGVTGLLFGELALVVAFSLICSLLVSLSVVPMIASKLLVQPVGAGPGSGGGWRGASERFFVRLDDRYRVMLRHALHRPVVTITAALALLGASLLLLPWIGTEFLPPSDEG